MKRIGNFVASIAPKGWIAIGLVAVLIAGVIAAVIISGNSEERLVETARESGAADAVITGQNTTLDQLGDANDAEENLEAGGERSASRFAECLRNSRRKPACERYRPLAE
jgi:threonine dehydrogenase-like Zn-dependent dehydrogenase